MRYFQFNTFIDLADFITQLHVDIQLPLEQDGYLKMYVGENNDLFQVIFDAIPSFAFAVNDDVRIHRDPEQFYFIVYQTCRLA